MCVLSCKPPVQMEGSLLYKSGGSGGRLRIPHTSGSLNPKSIVSEKQ